MPKPIPYAKFLCLLNDLKIENPDSEFEGCEDVLAFMHTRESEGTPVKITDLVQSLRFGTGPTVHRKITTLEGRGLISVTSSKSDGRAKVLSCTAAGRDILQKKSLLMRQSLNG